MGMRFQLFNLPRLCSALVVALTVAGCGGGGDDAGPSGPASGPASGPQITRIGAAGGTAPGPGGSQAAVPAGALAQDVDIGIEASSAGAPPLPADATPIGTVYAFTPHGTTFAQPVSVTVPFDPARLPAGSTPALYKTTAGRVGWAEVPGAMVNGATMVGSVSGFSNLAVVIPPLIKADPRYEWEFGVYPGNGLAAFIPPQGSGEQVGGVLSVLADLGQQPLDLILPLLGQTLPKDGRANGYVFAQGNGVTYGTLAEAPFGALNTPDPIGGRSRLKQWQSFKKVADDATLTFTLTSVVLRLEDYTRALNRRGVILQAEAMLSVGAYLGTDRSKYFYYRGGRATAWGERGTWAYRAPNFSFSRGALWDESDFEQIVEPIAYSSENETCVGELVRVRFKQPRTYSINLSSVPTDAEFTVRADVETVAVNAKGGNSIADCQGSHAYAYLRDPQEAGGPTIETTGLLPVATLTTESPPRDAYEPPASCPGGTIPAAGTLQFSTGFFAISEAAGSAPSILVTRTGGSTGAVSATFATLNGTAVAGTDYQSVLTTVHFGDGDSGTRVVEVPIIPNSLDQVDRTVLLALSEPGGCAALGAPSSAVLTIEDDDPPQLTTFTVGGTVTGLAGSGLTIANLTRTQAITANGSFQLDTPLATGSVYQIRVTAQPVNPRQSCVVTNGDGTVGTANITDVQIACTTLPEPGSLDPGFGTGGRAWFSDAGTVPYDVELARQSDGKLLVVNGSNRLRRLLADGKPDPSFGTAGDGSVIVTSGQRIAYQVSAVTVQPDGRIVVAGNAPSGVLGRPDMLVARYNADGTLDTSFAGGLGINTFDLSTYSDGVSQVLLEPDGSILLAGVVGDSSGGGDTNFAVLKLTAAGTIDPSYGKAGLASVGDDIFDVPRAAARTGDGGVVLVGRIARSGGALADMGLVKLTSAGLPDPSFGSNGNGIVRPLINGGHEEGRDVVVQPDGKIVVLVTGSTLTWLTRYLADGQLDRTFGINGEAAVPTPMNGWALALQADGSVWVAGEVPGIGVADYGLMRFTASGQPDTTFNNGAVLALDLFGGYDEPGAMLLQPDGRLAIAGRAYNGSSLGLGLVRLVP
jgi:uncharacterized delta-60 repeat protein